ncbi:unnamed protein product, partial [Mesorhabditis spiculigera]
MAPHRIFPVVLLLLAYSEFILAHFELPTLTVQYSQKYLHRSAPTVLTCELSIGWSSATFRNIDWQLDGVTLGSIKELNGYYFVEGGNLHLNTSKEAAEGNYQCLAELTNVRLRTGEIVDVRIISPPLFVRKARMTKFIDTIQHVVQARQGEVARLPCVGMPDVLPSPAQVCFEKVGGDGRCFGDRNERDEAKYMSFPTGLQIALVQPGDAGEYICVVKNTYTNASRKSNKAVILSVTPSAPLSITDTPKFKPQLLYPGKGENIVDVRVGQDVILECVFSKHTKVIWKRNNEELPGLNHDDEYKPFKLIWGNLRIKNVSQGDVGVYSCHGLNPLADDATERTPTAHYKMLVYGATGARMDIENTRGNDRKVLVSCTADNQHYELPMLYVNGTPLASIIDKVGTVESKNFMSNPLNMSIEFFANFSGSIQCLSHPAMREAEIFGPGLERGRSANYYVVRTGPGGVSTELISQGPSNATVISGERVELPCIVNRGGSKYWKFLCPTCNTPTLVKIIGSKMRITGSNTLRIEDAQPEDEGWYTCIVRESHTNKESTLTAYLRVIDKDATTTTMAPEPIEVLEFENMNVFINKLHVRVMWDVAGTDKAKESIKKILVDVRRKDGPWILDAATVDGQATAAMLTDLIPNESYIYRLRAIRKNGSEIASRESRPFDLEMPDGAVKPDAPTITSLEPVSGTTLLLKWDHKAVIPNAAADEFLIVYRPDGEETATVKQVTGSSSLLYLKGLKPLTEYTIFIRAQNEAGNSPQSKAITATTLDSTMENGLFHSIMQGVNQMAPGLTITAVLIIFGVAIVTMTCLLITCVCCCNRKSKKEKKMKTTPTGKYLDTSYRIFNEQKAQKPSKGEHYVNEHVDESSPLKGLSGMGNHEMSMPNLYGDVVAHDQDAEYEPHLHYPASENNYVNTGTLNRSGIYDTTPTARYFCPENGTTQERVVKKRGYSFPTPLTQPLLPVLSTPEQIIGFDNPDALLFSPPDAASNSLGGSSEPQTATTCDSPPHPFGGSVSGSDQGPRNGGYSSRGSELSTEGNKLHTFKPITNPNTTSFTSTFDKRIQESSFTKNELKYLYQCFKQNCPSGYVTRAEFVAIFHPSAYANLVFDTFDDDNNGRLSFSEFVQELSMFSKGTIEERLDWVFDLYDTHRREYLTEDDFQKVAIAMYGMVGIHYWKDKHIPVDLRRLLKNQFQKLDTNSDGRITRAEFIEGCLKSQDLLVSIDNLKVYW